MKRFKRVKIIYLLVVVAVVFAGVGLIKRITNQSEGQDMLSALGQEIYFTYTDDNVGEDLIIKSDKKNYDGFNGDVVYFNITNTRRRAELVDLQVHFDNGQAGVGDIAKWDRASNNWASLADQPLVLLEETDFGSSQTGQVTNSGKLAGVVNLVTKKKTEYLMGAKETAFFKMAINYPPLSQGEFYIEAQGNKGGYGLLDPWYSSNWAFRKKITIEADQVATTTDRARFPVLATTTDSDLASKARSDGYDIVFTSSDGQTVLNYEREKYTSATGELVAWIQASLSSTTDTVLYMYYGNANASTDNATTTGVWEDSYKGIWHLANDGVATTTYPDFLDSTSFDNDGSSKNMTGDISNLVSTSTIDGGVGFDGVNDLVEISDSNDFDSTNITISAWVKFDQLRNDKGEPEVFLRKQHSASPDYSWYIMQEYSGGISKEVFVCYWINDSGTSFNQRHSQFTLAIDTWYHVVEVRDGSSLILYVNGNGTNDWNPSPSGTTLASDGPVNIGAKTQSLGRTDGIIDEVRVSNVARSAQWIATEYNNQQAVSEFLTFGAEEDTTPTEFISTIQQSGGDYDSLSTWEDAVECNLTATSTRVFSGSLTGTLDENNTVELYRGGTDTGIDAAVVATTSSQILVDGITGDISDGLVAQSGDLWRKDASNYWTISGAAGNQLGDTAIAIAKIDGAWTSADQTAVTIDGWTTDSTHYIKIYTTETARHSGVWDTSKYRLKATVNTLLIYDPDVIVEGLQIEVTDLHGYGNAIYIQGSFSANVKISKNIIRETGSVENGGMAISIGSNLTGGTIKVDNNIIYDFNASDYGIWQDNWSTIIYAYNNTIYNCSYGFYNNTVEAAWFVAKNNIAYNNTDNYNGTFTSSDYNLSGPTQTDAPGSNSRNGVTVIFADEAGDDFHLSHHDTWARNQGINLTHDANLAFSDDIDGDSRNVNKWDIGADEATIYKTIINAPQANKFTSGLVGYWSFDGQDMDWASTTAEALDRSGNSNNGNVTNFGKEGAVIGRVGQALEFDGVDDYVDLGTMDVSGNGITLAAWIKADSFLADYYDNRIISKASGTNEADHYWMLSSTKDGSMRYLRFRLKTDGTTNTLIASSGYLYTDKWFYAVATYDGSDMYLYKDGVQVGSTGKTGTIDTSASVGVNIGRNPDGYGEWDGIIDEVRIYNRALSAEEITDLYRAGARKFQVNTPITQKYTSGLVGHWTFNGEDMDWASTTAEALDRSGQGNNGNVTNFGQEGAVIGQVGQALDFDGSDDYVDVADSDTLSPSGDMTVSAWVKLDQLANDKGEPQYIVRKAQTGGLYEYGLYQGYAAGEGEERFYFQWENSVEGEFDSSHDADAVGDLSTDTWYHVVGVKTSSKVTIYVNADNTVEWEDSVSGSPYNSDMSLRIGAWASTDFRVNGLIDEVRVYNRALSADEVLELYRAGSRGATIK